MENSVLELLSYLKSNGAVVKLVEGSLKIDAKKGVITPEVANGIRENKTSIVSYLQRIRQNSIIEKTGASRFPLTNGQKRLWVLSQEDSNSIAFNLTGAFKVDFPLETEVLQQAWKQVLLKHEVLRTVFFLEDGDIFQCVKPFASEYELTIAHVGASVSQTQLQEQIIADSNTPMNLEKGPLCKANLCSLDNGQKIFYYKVHHLISDGWSMEVLWSDLLRTYSLISSGEPADTDLPFNYGDFAVWQNEQLTSEQHEEAKNYWSNKFSDGITSLNLPYTKPTVATNESAVHTLEIDDQLLIEKIQKLSQSNGVSNFIIFTTLLNTLLYRYSGQKNITIGTPVSGRNQFDASNQIGLYINTLLINNAINEGDSFNDLLLTVGNNVTEALQHQNYPYDLLVSELGAVNAHPISVFLEYVQQESGDESEEALVSPFLDIPEVAKFDITVKVYFAENQVRIDFIYRLDKFSDRSISKMGNHLKNLIDQLVANPESKIETVEFLLEEEREKLLAANNDTNFNHDVTQSIVHRFGKVAQESPNQKALIFEENHLTYKEFDEQSNRVANYLLTQNVGTGDFVAVAMKPSITRMVTLFGILKAGAAYVPISVDYPKQRIDQIKESSNFKYLISNDEDMDLIPYETLSIDPILAEDISTHQPKVAIQPEQPAYVIYTSGSTGKPKGVVINHGALVNRIEWMQHCYPIGKKDVVLHKTIFTFDVSVWEIVWFATQGATLSILPYGDEKLPDRIIDRIERDKVSVMHFVPAMLNGFLTYVESLNTDTSRLQSLKYVFASGEELKGSYVNRFNAYFSESLGRLINLYGPTEATIDVTSFDCDKEMVYEAVPIGKPVHNTQLYVLDAHLNVLPEDCLGQLYIGGVQLCSGYLNDAERTKELFIDSPFKKGEKIYKTGDLAKWNNKGEIEYYGRIDQQVKIRGYRIELGEIELAIESIDEVALCAVQVVERGGVSAELLAIVQVKEKISEEQILQLVKEKLPDYMVPNNVNFIEEMPLSPNGKINRKVLSRLKLDNSKSKVVLEPLKTAEQKMLATVWQSILKSDRIGANSNFYELGGDSIKSILVTSKLRQNGYHLPVTEILSNPVLEKMAEKISPVKVALYTPKAVSGITPLTPTQQDFLNSDPSVDHLSHFNQSLIFKVNDGVNIEQFKNAFEELIEHHDQLRAKFMYQNGVWSQEILDQKQFRFDVEMKECESEQDFSSYLNSVQASFNLTQPPLFKLIWAKVGTEQVLGIVMHHLLIDGVSWRILLEDLSHIYLNDSVSKIVRSHSTKDWNQLLTDKLNSEDLLKDILFWKRFNQGSFGVLVPENSEGTNAEYNIDAVQVQLCKEVTATIVKNAHKLNADVNTVALAALKLAVKAQFGIANLAVQMEGHGRAFSEEIDLTRTIGWYTSIYPVRLGEEEKNLLAEIKSVRRKLASIPNKGATYLFLKNAGAIPSISHASVLFNYLGDLGNDLSSDENAPLLPINLDRGKEVHDHLTRKVELEISGMILSDQLSLSVLFSKERWSKETMLEFSALLEKYIVQLSEALTSNSAANRSNHDFYFDLSSSDFESLNYASIEEVYPMLDTQQGIYYHWLHDKNSTQYINQISFSVKGQFDKNVLQQALDLLIGKHEILRSRFDESTGDLLQVILNETECQIATEDISNASSNEREQLKSLEREKLFDLRNDPAYRLLVIQNGDIHEVVWTNHHIIFDGWSLSLFINELNATYLNLLTQAAPVSLTSSSLLNYFQWNENRNDARSKQFWNDYLKGIEQVSNLPTLDKQTTAFVKKEWNYNVGQEKSDQIQSICAQIGITQNNFFLFAWGVMLAELSGNSDISFAAMNSGRSPEVSDIDEMLGLFININPVRVQLDGQKSIREALKDFHVQAIQASPHQYLSFRKILNTAGLNASDFDHVFLFQNFGSASETIKQDKNLEIVETTSYEETNYNFVISIFEGKGLVVKYEYNESIYEASLIANLQNRYINILDSLAEGVNSKVVNELVRKELQSSSGLRETATLSSFITSKLENQEQAVLLNIWETVLEKNTISIDDDFFLVGGDSILSIKLTVLINKAFGSSLEIANIYQARTIKDLAVLIQSSEKGTAATEVSHEKMATESQRLLAEIDGAENYSLAYPMTDMEFGMMYDSMVGEVGTYHIQTVYHVKSQEIDLSRLNDAVTMMAEKHFVLRSEFQLDASGKGIHLIKKELDLNIEIQDLSDKGEQEVTAHLIQFLEEERSNNFSWNDHPLWRINLFKVAAEKYVFVWQVHHALMDGWSSNQFFSELYACYESGAMHTEEEKGAFEAAYLTSIQIAEQERSNDEAATFWKQYTAAISDVELFGTTSLGLEKNFSLTEEQTALVLDRSKKLELPVKVVLLTAYLMTIESLVYASNLTIGLVTNTRPLIERSEELLGNFLNTVPFQFKCTSDNFLENAKKVDQELTRIKAFDRYPLSKSLRESTNQAALSSAVEILFNYNDFTRISGAALHDDSNGLEGFSRTKSKLDLSVELRDKLYVNFSFNSELTLPNGHEFLVHQFTSILERFTSGEDSSESIEIALPKKLELSSPWELFLQNVEVAGDQMAIRTPNEKITFQELHDKVEDICSRLSNQGVQKGDVLAVQMTEAHWYTIAFLAAMKLGYVYVPIDNELPVERKKYMLQNSGARYLWNNGGESVSSSCVVIEHEALMHSNAEKVSYQKPQAEDPLYMIYTSGTTGDPKGVLLNGKGISNLQGFFVDAFNVGAKDKVLQFAKSSFDASIWEYTMAMLTGAELCFPSNETIQSATNFTQFLIEEKITVLTLPPVFLQNIEPSEEMAVRLLITAGSEPNSNVVAKWNNYVDYINAYGPTETTVCSNVNYLPKNSPVPTNISIGVPVPNSTVTVMSDRTTELPEGAIGEIVVFGPNVALGYVGDSEKTADRFITKNDEIVGYRTGDFGQLINGELHFLGRRDRQVKIRGYRIELGDIESQAVSIDGISQAAAFIENDKITMIYVSERATEVELRKSLTKLLPNYMVPTVVSLVEFIPVSHSGKLDEKAASRAIRIRKQVAMNAGDQNISETERTISALWKEVLKDDYLDHHTNFFDAGGDSISLMNLHKKLELELGQKFPIVLLFQYATIKEMSALYTNHFKKADDRSEALMRGKANRARQRNKRNV